MATSNIKENIDSDIHKVWEIVLAVEKYNQCLVNTFGAPY